MLDYKGIEAFAYVVREGGFEKAARALFLTQSAISQRLKGLEESVGSVLLVRSNPPKPTEAGQHVLRLWNQMEILEGDFSRSLNTAEDRFTRLPIGVNADSLDVWFLHAIREFVQAYCVLPDLRVEDQDVTHELLRQGEVVGCVSSRAEAMQGCQVTPLGFMDYRLAASPDFVERWFSAGVSLEAAQQAPFVIYNREDELHETMLPKVFPGIATNLNASYVPSSLDYMRFIHMGMSYGLIPERQMVGMLSSGELVDLSQGVLMRVHLYWHSWNLDSQLLTALREALVTRGRALLTAPYSL